MTQPNDTTARPAITAETTMEDAIRRDPNLPMILMRFHIGGCSMCGFEPRDTVARVAEENGVPLADLLRALNGGAA
jgi:hypothetical protein